MSRRRARFNSSTLEQISADFVTPLLDTRSDSRLPRMSTTAGQSKTTLLSDGYFSNRLMTSVPVRVAMEINQ